MTHDELSAGVRAIITKHLPPNNRDAEVADDSKITDTLGLDSLSLLEATVEIEDWLDFELSEYELAGLVTVGDLISHLVQRLGLLEAAA